MLVSLREMNATVSDLSGMLKAMSSPIVLIAGGEDFLADREVSKRLAASRKAEPLIERRDIDATADSAAGDFVDACSPGLFGDAAVVVVDGIEQANDELQKEVLALISDSTQTTAVLLIQRGLVKGRGFVDKIKKSSAETVTFEKPKGKAFDDFIMGEFKLHKRKIAADALRILRISVGDDLRALSGAISQLSSDVDVDPITADAVEKYYEGMAGVSGFSIADAVFEGRTVDALVALRWAIERDPNVGPAVIATAANTLRSLVAVASAAGGESDAALASQAGVPPWKIRTLRDQARRWRPAQLADAALLLTKADAALKGGEIDALGGVEILDPLQRQALLERTLLTIARSASR